MNRLLELVARLGVNVTIGYSPTREPRPSHISVGQVHDDTPEPEPVVSGQLRQAEVVRFK